MNPQRRRTLKVLAGASAGAAAAVPARAATAPPVPADAIGMLYDTTLCIGCKACVFACQQANGLEPETDAGGLHLAPVDLSARTKNVIKLYDGDGQVSFVKAQCMHCIDPACASACMLGSLHKDERTGVVGYDPQYCVGCRFCMIGCPFGVPKFEFHKANAKIVKCELCRHRVADGAIASRGEDGFTRYPAGMGPACAEVCPRGAVIYGRRDELLAAAKDRIAASPGRYHRDRVYGETDGGGTQVLYLSHVAFEKIGLPDFEAWGLAPGEGVPATMRSVQHGIYQGFVAPVVLYGALATVLFRNRSRNGGAPGAGTGDGGSGGPRS